MRARCILFLSTTVLVMSAWGGTVTADSHSQSREADALGNWRRTTNGWERRAQWSAPLIASDPALHPAVVASFEVLAVLLVLLATSNVVPEKVPLRGLHGASSRRLSGGRRQQVLSEAPHSPETQPATS